MLEILKYIEKNILPNLLGDSSNWKSVFVDYHPPFVQRLWTSIDIECVQYRIYLHRILPCELKDALFHPHPWPSAMRILSGKYSMITGYGAGNIAPPVSMTLSMEAGTSYEMVNEDAWHAVSPDGEPAYSLMVTGTPWERESPKSSYKLNSLDPTLELEILDFFRKVYSK